ncbi:hypothetical protein Anas_04040 [Armadillidium nasatum]|uniref:Uncharacterized protein n=1 Tax=Armadillidium nasatum TaxID=96803 RepID=A0A5N5SRZ9_9CRUS|nr:hypothetical protein Anas_04040 [Armadillidium nasatum]
MKMLLLKDNAIFPCDAHLHQSVPYQCKRIKLANLSPVSLAYSFEPLLKFKQKKCKKYDISALKFVKHLMGFVPMTEFECISTLEDVCICEF